METANFPRRAVELGLPRTITANDWLITITDYRGEHITPGNKFGRLLYLRFDDVTEPGENSIQLDQAEAIAQFIREAQQAGVNVWVNCHAGICRSGAVVRVLVELGWKYQMILSPPGIPNTLVYRMIRQQFSELKYSWEE